MLHANQIAPVDAALWLAVGGIACLTAVECARRAAGWLRERRERAFREDAGRLRKIARLRARLEEAEVCSPEDQIQNERLDNIALSLPIPMQRYLAAGRLAASGDTAEILSAPVGDQK